MTEEIKQYAFSKEEKLRWWGPGEWVEEPDYMEFTHEGYRCKVVRAAAQEPSIEIECVFGGHLCGYILIPKEHPYFKLTEKDYDKGKIPIDVHGGITFFEEGDQGKWTGFDCGHSYDLVPSMQEIKDKMRLEFETKFPQFKNSPLWQSSYKNIDFVIAECKSMAEQLKETNLLKTE